MKSTFYYDRHYLKVAEKVKEHINSAFDFLSEYTKKSPRATGDAIESLIAKNFNCLLEDWCLEYLNDFTRKAMADFAFKDKEGFYSAVDVKTHREDAKFSMPNLTSVERLAEFYEADKNVFSLIIVKYKVNGIKLTVTEVTFSPIEFLSWDCLTVGALGWGQIQIKNSNIIKIMHGFSRKKWMMQLCNKMLEFYPKEILKIQKKRIGRFEEAKSHWETRKDIW